MSVPSVPDPRPTGTRPIPAESGGAAERNMIRPFHVGVPEDEVAERPGARPASQPLALS